MRNKAKFIEDFEAVAKPEIIEAVDPVQDAAHTMNQLGATEYHLTGNFTKDGQEKVFQFEVQKREKTDDPTEEIDDYFYIGRGE